MEGEGLPVVAYRENPGKLILVPMRATGRGTFRRAGSASFTIAAADLRLALIVGDELWGGGLTLHLFGPYEPLSRIWRYGSYYLKASFRAAELRAFNGIYTLSGFWGEFGGPEPTGDIELLADREFVIGSDGIDR